MRLAEELRARVSGGEVLFGTFLMEVSNPGVVPILKRCGFGFFMIDMEHSSFDYSDMRELIAAGQQYGLCPMVRVAGPERDDITKALDAGAEGIIVAMSRSLEDVRRAVLATKYPPLGQRGVHMLRPHTDFSPPKDAAAYMDAANRNIITAIQIETAESVPLIEEIAAMPGVDMMYIGPGDLSVALGYPGMSGHEQVLEVAVRTARACRRSGKIAGCHATEPNVLGRLIPEGVSLFGHFAELRLLWSAGKEFIESAGKMVKEIKKEEL